MYDYEVKFANGTSQSMEDVNIRRRIFFNRFSVCSFWRIQKQIFDPRFARFRGRKERKIQNWNCTRANLSQTRSIKFGQSEHQKGQFGQF